MKRLILLLGLVLLLAGCSVMNPYEEDFKCPQTDDGKCVDVETAYYESKGFIGQTASANSTDYEQALYGRMTDLLQAPSTPVVVPPKVMRVLMLPYEGEDSELYMLRYAYIFVDRPRWVLTDPLKGGK
jgi:conjugal transfer pilus assembly protein TraV